MVGPHRLPCERPIASGRGERPPVDARWVLPATILGSSLSFIDGSVVNAAVGLAFGGGDEARLTGATIVGAYRRVIFGAAVLAGLSASTAALTIRVRVRSTTDESGGARSTR